MELRTLPWWACDTAMLRRRLRIRHSWWLRAMPEAQESEAALESGYAESGYAEGRDAALASVPVKVPTRCPPVPSLCARVFDSGPSAAQYSASRSERVGWPGPRRFQYGLLRLRL